MAACAGNAPVAERDPAAAEAPTGWKVAPDVVAAPRAIVVTEAPRAAEAALGALRAGGNAVDAAIAAAFALAVVYPEAGNIGGGGFMVVRLADGTAAALDFRETAPLAAHRTMYVNGDAERSRVGHLASGVPGAVAGLWAAHARFGSLPWSELVAPAIRYAEAGFVLDSAFVHRLPGYADRLARFPASAALFLPDGEPLRLGETWRNPELAATLARIAERGAAGFYEGETADLIAAEMRRGGGLITHEDLRRYQPKWREPVRFTYRGHDVIGVPPPSSGGITLALAAGLLERYEPARMLPGSTERLHLHAEALRRAFAVRNAVLGDPDYVDIRQARLLARAFIDSLGASMRHERATPSTEIMPGLEERSEGVNTTHIGVVDERGNAVALTTTINDIFGSGVTVTGAGFLLNDQMDDFTTRPGSSNIYGLVEGTANAIAPGKRMLSSMSPTIVASPDGRTRLVTGARGGGRIISSVLQVLTSVVDHDADLARAVASPRMHHQHLPDVLYYESGGLHQAQLDSLRARGHDVRDAGGFLARAPTILRRNGTWTATPDARTPGGRAAGY